MSGGRPIPSSWRSPVECNGAAGMKWCSSTGCCRRNCPTTSTDSDAIEPRAAAINIATSKRADICPHVTHESKEVDGSFIEENTCGTTSNGVQYICPMTEDGQHQYCDKNWKCTTEKNNSKYVFYGSWIAERCGGINCPLQSQDTNCGKIGDKHFACPRKVVEGSSFPKKQYCSKEGKCGTTHKYRKGGQHFYDTMALMYCGTIQ